MSAWLRAGLLLGVLVARLPAHVAAQPTPAAEHDTQAWLLLLGQFPVGKAWTVHGEVQPRWSDDLRQREQLLLRTAVGRRVGTRTTLWAGYAYAPRFAGPGTTHEQRTWQQLTTSLPAPARWAPTLRIRQEQRFLGQWGDTSHRLRVLGRVVRPIAATAWSLAASDEFMVTFDSTPGGPRQGFDQNRLFGGVLRRLAPAVTMETGYLWQRLPATPTRATRHNHVLFGQLTYAPPRK